MGWYKIYLYHSVDQDIMVLVMLIRFCYPYGDL